MRCSSSHITPGQCVRESPSPPLSRFRDVPPMKLRLRLPVRMIPPGSPLNRALRAFSGKSLTGVSMLTPWRSHRAAMALPYFAMK